MKRLFDMLISALVLFLLIPVLVLISIAIKLDSKGPVIFRQERVGYKGKSFFIYKFRSMIVDSDVNGAYFTSKNDKRVTKVGRFLRRTSLDELPQLLNVLLNDMSLVGPRPNVPAQKVEYRLEEWEKRNSVKPGITGLAQAKLRSEATPEQRTMLDLEYVSKASLFFDFFILWLTIKQVMFKGGN